jgi:hypothetical protein
VSEGYSAGSRITVTHRPSLAANYAALAVVLAIVALMVFK